MKHLPECFDNIQSLSFCKNEDGAQTKDAITMSSSEGEEVTLTHCGRGDIAQQIISHNHIGPSDMTQSIPQASLRVTSSRRPHCQSHALKHLAGLIARHILAFPPQILQNHSLKVLHLLLLHWRNPQKNISNQRSRKPVVEESNIPLVTNGIKKATERARLLRELYFKKALVGGRGASS